MMTRQQVVSFRNFSKTLLKTFDCLENPTHIVQSYLYNRYRLQKKPLDTLLHRWFYNLRLADVMITRNAETFLIDYQKEMDWINIADFIVMTCLLKKVCSKKEVIDELALLYLEEYAMEWIVSNGGWECFPPISHVVLLPTRVIERYTTKILISYWIGTLTGGAMTLLFEYLSNKVRA